ncbi:MAG: PAS domain S-box protein [Candidatus Nanopelagicales bacterium]
MANETFSGEAADAQRLAELAIALPDVEYIVRLAPDRGFEYVSDSVIHLVGYTPQEHYDDPNLGNRLVDPRDLQVLVAAAQVPPGEIMEYTLRWIARDGRRVWTHHRCRIHCRGDGAQVLYGVARDVTPFKEAEARYRLLAEHATDVVVTGDQDGVLQWVSESITSLLGWQPAQWVGRPFLEMVHPDDRQLIPPVEHQLLTGESEAFEVRLAQADGGYKYVDVRATPMFDDDGVVIGLVAGWGDITAQRAAQDELAESEARLRLLAENAADVVFLLTAHNTVEWVSPSFYRQFGYDIADLRALTPKRFVHPDDLERADQMMSDAQSGVTDTFTGEVRLCGKDGRFRWWAVTVRRSSSTHFVVAFRDVDDEVQGRLRIHAEQQRRTTALETMLDPFVVFEAVRDESGDIVDLVYSEANQAACTYLGLDRGELVGSRLLVRYPEQGTSGRFDRYVAALNTQTPLVIDAVAIDGEAGHEPRYLDIRMVPVDSDTLSFTWRDITERYDAARRIAASEEQFRLLAENASDVVMRSIDGRLDWVAPSLTRMLGWSPGEWVGQSLTEFAHPADLELARLGDVEHAGGRTTTRLRMRAKDGAYHWVEVHANKVPVTSGGQRGIVASLRTIDEVVAYEAELQRRATFDDLTGALKREEAMRLLTSMASYWRDPGRESAVLFCDLDTFKQINDTYGHVSGDDVLRTVVDRIRGAVRASDVVARMGGDEFLVVLDGIHGMAEALQIAEQIRLAVGAPIVVADTTVTATLSIGVILRKPGEHPDVLISRADTAMYAAKGAGRNQVVAVE